MTLFEIKMRLLEFNPGNNYVDKADSTPYSLPHKTLKGWKGGGQKSPPDSLGVPFFCASVWKYKNGYMLQKYISTDHMVDLVVLGLTCTVTELILTLQTTFSLGWTVTFPALSWTWTCNCSELLFSTVISASPGVTANDSGGPVKYNHPSHHHHHLHKHPRVSSLILNSHDALMEWLPKINFKVPWYTFSNRNWRSKWQSSH